MSLVSLLSIAKSALMTHQRALNVTGHNIANANVAGYTRQRLALEAETPLRTPYGTLGRGVTDGGVFAERDVFLDSAFRRQQSAFGHSDTVRDFMARIEQLFGEPSDTGLGASLDSLFGAFGDLANDPSSLSARNVVQQSASTFVRQLHSLDSELTDLTNSVVAEIRGGIERINQITGQIADLNKRIVADGGPNHTAPDLEDQRGRLLDELATLADTRVLPRSDGSVGVIVGDSLLVENGDSQSVELRTLVGGGFGIGVVGSARVLATGGSMGALSELSVNGVPAIRQELDRLASALVARVNAVHQTGTTPGNVTNTNFFDPAGTTAATIALAAPIAASANNIAAGATADPGDGAVALQLAQLRTTAIPALNGTTAGEFYSGIVSTLGAIVHDAQQEADATGVLRASVSAQRSALTGVSVDEEMVNLITQQQAFAAAAKLVTVADELMQDVLNMV